MISVIQRVSSAEVKVNQLCVGKITRGILALIAIEKNDTTTQVERLADKLLCYRIFPDTNGKMNRNVVDIAGGILLVPQFTLAADTQKGTRPSFTPAAPPDIGIQLFDQLFLCIQQRYEYCSRGQFGADMAVSLINDGPVTFILHVRPQRD